jgi:hypothetical protein
MKVLIWVYENQLENLLNGEKVDYFLREPGVFENTIQVSIDIDTYYKLKDNK